MSLDRENLLRCGLTSTRLDDFFRYSYLYTVRITIFLFLFFFFFGGGEAERFFFAGGGSFYSSDTLDRTLQTNLYTSMYPVFNLILYLKGETTR